MPQLSILPLPPPTPPLPTLSRVLPVEQTVRLLWGVTSTKENLRANYLCN